MIKLKALLTEAPQKEGIWHVYDKWTRDATKTFAIVRAPNFQTAMERAKAESQTHNAEEISKDEARTIKIQLGVRLKRLQKALKNIKI